MRQFIGIVLACVGAYVGIAQPDLGKLINPAPAVIVPSGPQPTGKAVAAVAALSAYPTQSHSLGAFYDGLANCLAATDHVKTAGQFAAAHKAGLQVLVASTAYKGAPQIGGLIDDAIAEAMGGLQDVALDAAKKAALVTKLRELATGFSQVK